MKAMIIVLISMMAVGCLPEGTTTQVDLVSESEPSQRQPEIDEVVDDPPPIVPVLVTKNVKIVSTVDDYDILSIQYRIYELGFIPGTTDYCVNPPNDAVLLEQDIDFNVPARNQGQSIVLLDKNISETQMICFRMTSSNATHAYIQMYLDNQMEYGLQHGQPLFRSEILFLGWGAGINE